MSRVIALVLSFGLLAPAAAASTPTPGGGPVWSDALPSAVDPDNLIRANHPIIGRS
jgi:hypothetical protein